MKKIILILTILLCFFTSYAQDTKPTKQETMDWIAGKMKGYVGGDNNSGRLKFESYKDGTLNYTYLNTNREGEDFYITKVIDLNLINEREGLRLKGKKGLLKTSDEGKVEFSDSLVLSRFISEDMLFDEDFQRRFFKALDTLIEYNKEGQNNEKF